ncbi:hypothetical protein SAMN05444279_13519 [Ruegeria intermedia]|uniref:Uncharacterized protein n=1 Tax=Ruegeria intermedia TaxID=996115 RepID=A0A1M5BAV4_9RHOB|nr:hypothetical protein [Ruegeria intermedia]SHF39312.1 hypothetical protein SAMN05444279_13519 [Ruegeria intermedia]
MTRTHREYIALCAAEGVTLLRIETHRKHCRLCFEAGFVTASASPSDRRNLKNLRSAIRRLHR